MGRRRDVAEDANALKRENDMGIWKNRQKMDYFIINS